MEDGIDPRVLASVDESRRDLLRKLLLGSAFVLPAVASFPMDALAQNQTPIRNGNITTDGAIRANPGAGKPANPVDPGSTGKTNEPAKR